MGHLTKRIKSTLKKKMLLQMEKKINKNIENHFVTKDLCNKASICQISLNNTENNILTELTRHRSSRNFKINNIHIQIILLSGKQNRSVSYSYMNYCSCLKDTESETRLCPASRPPPAP